MASAIKNERRVIDQAIVEALAAEVTIEANPEVEDQPVVFDAFTRANAVLIQPHLEALVAAYRGACKTNSGRRAAQLFLENMLAAEA
jgi:hypothetical protein